MMGRLIKLGILRHEFKRFALGRGILLHAAFPIENVSRVEKLAVVSFADELFQLLHAEALVEIDELEFDASVEQETSCFAAGGSSGLLMKLDLHCLRLSGRTADTRAISC